MAEDLGKARGRIEIDIDGALDSLAKLRRENANTIGALNTAGRAAITAGTGLVAMGGTIVAGFGMAVKASMNLEKRLSYVKALTKLDEEGMEELRQKVLQLGADSAYTATEVADGFTELAKGGATAEQMINGLGESMINLGQAGDIGLSEAATAIISVSSVFGIAAEQSEMVADRIAGAANASIIEISDMAVSFKYAAGVAAQLGISLDDVSTALALMGQAGIKGSTAGTSLRRMLIQLSPRTDKAATLMHKLGIMTEDGTNRFFTAEGKAKGLSDIIDVLSSSLAGYTEEQKASYIATLFGDRAINTVIALTKGGTKAFGEFQDKVKDTSAFDIGAERLNNLSGDIEYLRGELETLMNNFGGPGQGPLRSIVQAFEKIVHFLNGLSDGTKRWITRLALVAAGVFLVSGAFLIFFGTMLRALAVAKQLRDIQRSMTGHITKSTGARQRELAVMRQQEKVAAGTAQYSGLRFGAGPLAGRGKKIAGAAGASLLIADMLRPETKNDAVNVAFDAASMAALGAFVHPLLGAALALKPITDGLAEALDPEDKGSKQHQLDELKAERARDFKGVTDPNKAPFGESKRLYDLNKMILKLEKEVTEEKKKQGAEQKKIADATRSSTTALVEAGRITNEQAQNYHNLRMQIFQSVNAFDKLPAKAALSQGQLKKNIENQRNAFKQLTFDLEDLRQAGFSDEAMAEFQKIEASAPGTIRNIVKNGITKPFVDQVNNDLGSIKYDASIQASLIATGSRAALPAQELGSLIGETIARYVFTAFDSELRRYFSGGRMPTVNVPVAVQLEAAWSNRPLGPGSSQDREGPLNRAAATGGINVGTMQENNYYGSAAPSPAVTDARLARLVRQLGDG